MVDFVAALHADRMKRAHARKDEEKERGQEKRKPTTSLRMSIGPDDKFAVLAQQLIEACDKVPCPQEDYIAGLRYIIGEVEIALQAAKETS